jgi:hypothetical protein
VVSFGPANNKYVTTYFRRSFSAPAMPNYTNLALRLLRDDGAIVYLNGNEIFRSNMPTGAVTYTTFASNVVAGAEETTFFTKNVDPSLLVPGNNVLAVELHQANATSTDLSFDLELSAEARPPPPPGLVVSRSGNRVVLSWSASYFGFRVQSTTNIAPGHVWSYTSDSVAASNGNYQVSMVASNAQQFFRLSRP